MYNYTVMLYVKSSTLATHASMNSIANALLVNQYSCSIECSLFY